MLYQNYILGYTGLPVTIDSTVGSIDLTTRLQTINTQSIPEEEGYLKNQVSSLPLLMITSITNIYTLIDNINKILKSTPPKINDTPWTLECSNVDSSNN